MRFTRRQRRPIGSLVGWLGAGLFVAWIVGAVPFLLLTPAGGTLAALVQGWRVAPAEPIVEPAATAEPDAAEPSQEAPVEVAAAEPAATATPSAVPAPERALGADAPSVVRSEEHTSELQSL